jgi:hypothetical protein
MFVGLRFVPENTFPIIVVVVGACDFSKGEGLLAASPSSRVDSSFGGGLESCAIINTISQMPFLSQILITCTAPRVCGEQ